MKTFILALTAVASLTMASDPAIAKAKSSRRSNTTSEVHLNPNTIVVGVWGHLYTPSAGGGDASQGTGWFINTSMLITNYHVVKGCSEYKIIYSDGRSVDVTLQSYNEACDLAILEVKTVRPDQSYAFLLPDSDDVVPGTRVYTVGFPHSQIAVTYGTVKQRFVNEINKHVVVFESIDLLIDQGSSGGPVMNERGYVIGMVEARTDMSQAYRCRIISANVIWEALNITNTKTHPDGFVTGVTTGVDLTTGMN
jgi:S1-C subfamily serine protease